MTTDNKWVERFDTEIAKFKEYELDPMDVVNMRFNYCDLIELRMMAKHCSELESHF